MFFSTVSERIVARHLASPGFRHHVIPDDVLPSSIYNLALRVRVLERHSDEEFLDILAKAAAKVKAEYAVRAREASFAPERILSAGREYLLHSRKPVGVSCYYLELVYSAHETAHECALHIVQTWELHSRLASLKGTYLHQKI